MLLEKLINFVHRLAPDAAICFSTTPSDTAWAVLRRVDPRSRQFVWPESASGAMTCPPQGRASMLRGLRVGSFGIAACLTVAAVMPVHEAAAQDAIGGAIIGGVGGAILGGALGGGRGAAIGAVVGAGTGAAIASEGERRRSGYYAYQRGCYMQRPDGYYVRVDQRYCY